ncbi:membrane protein [Photobacterium aquae]|uniref:Membrane protein n=1 Tax=Photobacterium aquae TaxID=1195763 RepID=A0A0J1GR62_9GAMM|nr:hypothetical protein [Photobacterium aquae]KLV02193.1 membrane protein [Photobacterium aquae]
MTQKWLPRLTVISLFLLGFQVSALYFLLAVLLLNTHHSDIFW